ncbi:retinoic acid early transcript 1E-like isoform X1 [Erinaceus europaeus]|uniref:Retinoic acid early transcript 1E-like isoform X1 n=1 Tax=Erinaceus europaeus TaxID=9365 RepID=A0ABM3YJS3_ERIEU|nr:retinoic acid early transcript 1E-like isoform X1 [Erinaceus europaeus]XP_060061314.1 retinoic acid early transcript 1E-like isoform X1 [Erinaceus europaeus]XP_060061315.1 retinoic acid early transcript 1E-like isoform X1 [Erinaceus europaeus]
MELAAPTAGLGLILLLLEARETLGGAHSLCLNFTVRSQASPGQSWCEAQGSVDGKPFLQYGSDSSKATPVGLLGEKVNATKAWKELSQTLEEVGRELRMVLLVTKPEKSLSGGPPSLQAQLCCQREAGECTGASWEFSINGQRALIDLMTLNWTVIDPGARGIKEEWESTWDLAEYLRRISTVICCNWLKEFLEHWEKMLKPMESPQKTPDSNQRSFILAGIIPLIIILSITIFMIHRKCSAVPAEASWGQERATSLDQQLMT